MRTPQETIDEVKRRLSAFHSPSFDREIVEELLALAAERDEWQCRAERAENALPGEVERQAEKNYRDGLIARAEKAEQERDRQYDENVNRIAAEGVAILRAEAAESRIATLERELATVNDFFPAHNRYMEKIWTLLGGPDPTRPDGENFEARIKEIVARAEKAERELAEARAEYEIEKVHAKGGYDLAAKLKAALEPFSAWLDKLDVDFADEADDTIAGGIDGATVTFGDLRRARAALGS